MVYNVLSLPAIGLAIFFLVRYCTQLCDLGRYVVESAVRVGIHCCCSSSQHLGGLRWRQCHFPFCLWLHVRGAKSKSRLSKPQLT